MKRSYASAATSKVMAQPYAGAAPRMSRIEARVVRATKRPPRAQRLADVLAAEVETGGEAVDLERHAGLPGDLEHALEVEGVLGAAVDEPARRVGQAAPG